MSDCLICGRKGAGNSTHVCTVENYTTIEQAYAELRARHEKLRRLVPFLLGEAEHPDHPGIWFGGEHPTQGGKFWWRRPLRIALLEDE